MRFMIRCDIEGVTGVTHPSQADPAAAEYACGVEMLHHDVSAVVDGILSTGEHEIWIYDMHYAGRNLDMRRLPVQVRVVCGKPHYRPGNLGQLTAGFDGQILVGLHSKAGSGELLAHSYEHEICDLLLHGISVGEIGLEAVLAGELGVPTVLVTGDSAGCAEACGLLGDIPIVRVKDSLGSCAGVCYPTAKTEEWLRAGGRTAVAAARMVAPLGLEKPVMLTIILQEGAFADHVRTVLKDAVHTDGRIVITADSLAAAWAQYLRAKPA